MIRQFLEGGKRLSYGARAITKGGPQALPKMSFPGGLLIGCDAGTLNFAKIKGTHTAMKSGMVAAEAVHAAVATHGREGEEITGFTDAFMDSWAGRELQLQRNFGPAQHKFGNMLRLGLRLRGHQYLQRQAARGRSATTTPTTSS